MKYSQKAGEPTFSFLSALHFVSSLVLKPCLYWGGGGGEHNVLIFLLSTENMLILNAGDKAGVEGDLYTCMKKSV